jgi:hypothetical protein
MRSPCFLCVCVYHSIVERQRLGKHVSMAAIEELLKASFYMRSMSYQRRVCEFVYRLTFARKRSGKNVPATGKNCLKHLFYEARFVTKESRRLFPPPSRISCIPHGHSKQRNKWALAHRTRTIWPMTQMTMQVDIFLFLPMNIRNPQL